MTETELMLTSLLNCRRLDLYRDSLSLTPSQAQTLKAMRSRRAAGEPLQYILGETDFMGYPIRVNSAVLIPRPETEILVTQTQQAMQKIFPLDDTMHIIDVGTGSGCIAIALAKLIPSCRITAIDVSLEALACARENALLNAVERQINFQEMDMDIFFNQSHAVAKTFQVIIANPPYIPTAKIADLPAEVRQEPWAALDGGIDGIRFYRALLAGARLRLTSPGLLALEFGDGQERQIADLVSENGHYKNCQFLLDYTQTPRVALIYR
ncbi:MAG: peptide chain release factor N(5)-glutamine methyltransferase [Candidatus Omnitrophica bacterium]|nr:peptide chain release factor N(5)-glutamine methyltransferase [Candidatus Omnitrophota bacterium]